MVDQLRSFASEVTRVAREVGTEGKLGGQADVHGVAGTWKDLTDSVNFMAGNLTGQVRNIADVTTAVANGDLSKKITVDVKGEILELKNTINTMVDQLSSFASEVTRVAREVGTEGKLGGQAEVKGVAGTWKDLTDNVNFMAGNLTSQVRGIAKVVTAVANGDLKRKLTVEAKGEIAELGRHDQRHDRHAGHLRRSGDDGGPRSGRRRQAGRPGQRARRRRHLEGPDRQRQSAGRQSDHPGARHRRSGHRRHQGRPDAVDHGRGAGRSRGAERQHQRNDPQSQGHDAEKQRTGLAQDQPGQVQPHVAGAEGSADRRPADSFGTGAGGLRPAGRLLHHGRQRARRAAADAAGQLCLPRNARTSTSRFELGEGLVGQCALEKQKILLTNVPPDYIRISSGLGEATPLNIIVLPVVFEGQVKAVLELASFERFNPTHQAFLDQLTESIGIVLNTIEANMRTEDLLKQSQSLAKELQSQQEELQQTNQELQEKAQLLAHQNVEVERKNREVEQARQALEEKAKQLALTSKYKSEFLANMSHELRTPLNSLLILSDQLSKNTDGNLTPKQIEFAKTIHSSGNDLLMLINDILDLSKIESGTVVVDVGELRFARSAQLCRSHVPPRGRSRRASTSTSSSIRICREPCTTDAKRLQQVIKNLLSNAFKFTHHGAGCADSRRRRTTAGTPTTRISTRADRVLAFSVSRHRHRHSAGQAADHLRGVPAGRRQHQPQVRRHGPGPGHQPRNRPPAGRRNPVGQPAERGSTFTLYLPQSFAPQKTVRRSSARRSEATRSGPAAINVGGSVAGKRRDGAAALQMSTRRERSPSKPCRNIASRSPRKHSSSAEERPMIAARFNRATRCC